MKLADDDTFGSIYNECSRVGHEGHFTQKDLLGHHIFDNIFTTLFFRGDKPERSF